MITPNDIETKVFSYSVRGYNKREVDEFLDQIMIDYQALLDQNAKMLERVHVLQKQVSEALDAMGCTRIVIAHRLSTIRHCDRILVLDKGNVTEDGTYDELIAKNGYFAELVARQRLDTAQEEN